MRPQWLVLSVICLVLPSGCATTYTPRPMEEVPFQARAQTQQDAGVRVMAAVPSAEETKEVFGLDLYRKGIQPIWLKIENNEKEPVWFLPYSIDPDYFSPLEVAYMHRSGYSKSARYQMDQYFHEQVMEIYIEPGTARSGFVFANLDEGTKAFNVDVIGEDRRARTFTFFIPVPGLRVDHRQVDFQTLYSSDEIGAYDESGLRKALEGLPCCATNKDGTAQGDPLNLVVIGEGGDVHHSFLRSGWNETETVSDSSKPSKKKYSASTRHHRYAPLSSLYVFRRPQDVAFQKARKTGQRSKVRLWLAPMQFQEKPVWVGQISRSIGARSISEKAVPKTDPDVDDTRAYLIQNLLYSQGLLKFGYVKGVGAATIMQPRVNLDGDPYITDGYRAVLWVSSKPIGFKKVEFVQWEKLRP